MKTPTKIAATAMKVTITAAATTPPPYPPLLLLFPFPSPLFSSPLPLAPELDPVLSLNPSGVTLGSALGAGLFTELAFENKLDIKEMVGERK